MMRTVGIIGAGITGISVANRLAQADVDVVLVDRHSSPGGRAVEYGCKATDTCVHCGVCLAREALAQLEHLSHLQLFLSSIPHSMRSLSDDSFEIELETLTNGNLSGTSETLHVDAVVVSTGFTPFNPVMNRKWGYGNNPCVMTGSELERLFYEEKYLPDDLGDIPKKIAFIQCVGSRNVTEGMAQCSRICCAYALRMAGRIKHEMPETDIDFYYMDIQRFGKNFESFWTTVSDKINFIRSLPISINIDTQGKPIVRFEASPGNACDDRLYDLVVLSHGLCPSDDSDEVADIFELNRNSNGFFSLPSYQRVASPLKKRGGMSSGIFIAGTCRGPMTIAECVEDASAVSEHVLAFLENKKIAH